MPADAMLAFDPTRVGLLYRSLCRTLDQLRAVPVQTAMTDPAHQAALSVRRAIVDIDTVWIPMVQRVLRAPLTPAASFVDDPAALAALTAQLRDVSHDPVRSRIALRTSHWSALVAQLASERQMLAQSTEHESVTVDEVDGALGAMGAVLGATLEAACSSAEALVALAGVSPYAAAGLLGTMGLDSVTLADTVAALLQRWLDEPHLLHVVGVHDDGDPVDGLLSLLVDDAAACTRFVAHVASHPEVLLLPGHDVSIAQQVVLTGTDPANVAPAGAGALVLPVIDAVTSSPDADPVAWRDFLVDLVTPWTVQFSPINHDWGTDAGIRNGLLQALVSSEGAAERLVRAGDRVLADVSEWIRRDSPSMEELAAYIGSLAKLISEDRMKDVRAKQSAIDLLFGVISVAVGALPLTLGVGLAATAVVWVAHEATTPDTHRAASAVNRGEDTAITITAASVALRVVQAWQVAGTLDTSFPLPPKANPSAEYPSLDFMDAFRAWRSGLPGGNEGPLADRITREVFTVLSPSQVGEHLVILRYGTIGG